MSSPNVSIANLSVARKTLPASNGEKLRALRFRVCISARFAGFARKRGGRTIRSQTMKIKKAGASRAPASAVSDLFSRLTGETIADYFWMLA
jgi:hypothetical protein